MLLVGTRDAAHSDAVRGNEAVYGPAGAWFCAPNDHHRGGCRPSRLCGADQRRCRGRSSVVNCWGGRHTGRAGLHTQAPCLRQKGPECSGRLLKGVDLAGELGGASRAVLFPGARSNLPTGPHGGATGPNGSRDG